MKKLTLRMAAVMQRVRKGGRRFAVLTVGGILLLASGSVYAVTTLRQAGQADEPATHGSSAVTAPGGGHIQRPVDGTRQSSGESDQSSEDRNDEEVGSTHEASRSGSGSSRADQPAAPSSQALTFSSGRVAFEKNHTYAYVTIRSQDGQSLLGPTATSTSSNLMPYVQYPDPSMGHQDPFQASWTLRLGLADPATAGS